MTAGSAAADTTDRADKTCASCGRRIEWRSKWARNWDEIRYCSDACRRRGVTAIDARLEATLLDMLGRHPRSTGVDPNDAIRAVTDDPDAAATLTEPARRAARRLVARGDGEIVQNGRVVDPSTAKGPFRIRRA
jgi:hypothetical protein